MASFSKVITLCRLTREPELSNVGAKGTALAKFGIAFDRGFGEAKKPVFVDCEAWGKLAERIGQHLQKGQEVLLESELDQDQWEDKQTGAKRSKHKLVVTNFAFTSGGKRDDDSDQTQNHRASQRPPVKSSERPAPQQPFGDEPQFKEDDIPF